MLRTLLEQFEVDVPESGAPDSTQFVESISGVEHCDCRSFGHHCHFAPNCRVVERMRRKVHGDS